MSGGGAESEQVDALLTGALPTDAARAGEPRVHVPREWVADSSLRLDAANNTLLGGAPLKFMRLSPAGFDLVERIVNGPSLGAGESVESLSRAELELMGRLVDNGMLHPLPGRDEPSAPSPGDVTVVIPVKGHRGRLVTLLDSLAHHSPDIAGVVVVDDGSTEPIDVEPGDFGPQNWPHGVTVIRRPVSGGPGVARNSGVEYVTTPVVMFLDSDCVVTGGWLWPLLGHLADNAVSGVASRVIAAPWFHYNRRLARYDSSHSPLDLGPEPARVLPLTRVAYVPTAALMLRVETFRDVGGFDLELRLGEDVDLVWRLAETGARLRYDPRSVVEHAVRPDLSSWMRQRFDYGTSAASLAARHDGNVAPVVMSRWSAVLWLAILNGHGWLAALLAAGTTAALPRKLKGCSARDAARYVLGGHIGAGGQLARAGVRVWWPILLTAALVSRRARVLLVGSVAWAVIDKHPRSPVDASLALLDDVSYGTGVWVGCWRRRSVLALLPRID